MIFVPIGWDILAKMWIITSKDLVCITLPIHTYHLTVKQNGMQLKLSDKMPNTFNAHRVIHLAEKYNKQHEVCQFLHSCQFLDVRSPISLLLARRQGYWRFFDIEFCCRIARNAKCTGISKKR